MILSCAMPVVCETRLAALLSAASAMVLNRRNEGQDAANAGREDHADEKDDQNGKVLHASMLPIV